MGCAISSSLIGQDAQAQESSKVRQLRETRVCIGCNLRQANLQRAYLQSANLQ
ncbi:MAG: pentapeptide repeat-containing protein, partial [Cyanobacteria bacterium P01_C01_bin.118]